MTLPHQDVPDSRRQTWHPDPQGYALDQERLRHDQALDQFGEYAIFVLLWNVVDHEAGLVDRCPTCYVSYGRMAEAYEQPSRKRCEDCFGTTFEGGYKAKIVRPSLWDANEEDYRENARGQYTLATASIQSTSDFRLRTGDFILRGDGTRWQMQTISTNHLRTGFLMPTDQRTAMGFNFGQVVREDESSVAYMISPDEAGLADINLYGIRYRADFEEIEDIREGASLI